MRKGNHWWGGELIMNISIEDVLREAKPFSSAGDVSVIEKGRSGMGNC